jgi:hypothetical protein
LIGSSHYKEGQKIWISGGPKKLAIKVKRGTEAAAGAVLIFVKNESGLRKNLGKLRKAARALKLAWVAYPKAGQLGTDINRDSIHAIAQKNGLDPVRQIAIDEIWSALRLKSLQPSSNKAAVS